MNQDKTRHLEIKREVKRKLWEEEKEQIWKELLKVHVVFPEIEKNNHETLRKKWMPLLDTIELYPPQIPKFIAKVIEDYHESLVQAGECVGITCAQSIGERQTQLTLNSFHSAGLAIATVVSGVPRFLELLNATKDQKISSCSFRLHPHIAEKITSPSSVRHFLGPRLVHRTLGNILKHHHLFWEMEEELWYPLFEQHYSNEFRHYDVGIKFFLDKQQLWEHRIPLFLIKTMIEKEYNDCCVVFSPNHLAQIDVFVDVSDLHFPEKSESSRMTENKFIAMFLEDVVTPRLREVVLCGCKNIEKMYIQKEGNQLKLETMGTNMRSLLGHPDLDMKSVCSNNMWEVLSCLGIESTRQFLLEEFHRVVSSDGTFLHPGHIKLLVDFMTYHGTITSISRYGMKKETNGPLSKASFEEVMDHFIQASFIGEDEPVESISASIICGKRSKAGTGLCSMIVDTEQLQFIPK
jgi:DNA-directed RNA polymerase beta' subunit